jgi:hypothetical protein
MTRKRKLNGENVEEEKEGQEEEKGGKEEERRR